MRSRLLRHSGANLFAQAESADEGEVYMERREFLTALVAGLGTSLVASHAQAFAPGAVPFARQTGVASDEDFNGAKIEKALGRGYWRHRKRRTKRYHREHSS